MSRDFERVRMPSAELLTRFMSEVWSSDMAIVQVFAPGDGLMLRGTVLRGHLVDWVLETCSSDQASEQAVASRKCLTALDDRCVFREVTLIPAHA